MKAPLEGHAWSYDGSVPVPPCHETVKWFVLEEEIEAHSNQVLALRRMLSADMALLPPKNKRSPVKRNRAITKDTLVVGSDHRGVSCKAFSAAQRARSAACWTLLEQGCGEDGFQFTPVAISRSTSLTSGEPKKPSDLASYRAAAAESIIVQPSMYTLDILPKKKDTDVLGHMMIHGRLFPVSKVSVKAVAQHVIEGKQFEAELVIEHTMFGDFIKDTVKHPAYQPKEHLVMLSVPITLGPQSDLLRQIGLGARVFDQTIRDGQAYSPIEAVDLQEGLSTVLNGEMFWYNGGKSLPGCTESVRWLVLETPITASLAQLNQLSRPVPGVDSTVLPVDSPITAKWKTYAGHIPPHAVQVDEECPAEHIGWSYLNTHCWDKCEVGCSQTCMIGQSQSPINVDTSAVTQERNDNFLHICRWKPVAQLHVANSGHSFVVANQQMGYIQQTGAGGYPDFYQVAQILVHMPSEHMLDGRIFHGELHVVHAKQISDEELDWTSLLVTAIFLEVGDLENGLLNQLLFPVKSKPEPPQVHQYEVSDYPIDLLRALGPVIDGPFYTYNGSLTTPPCSEYVKWFVFETPQSMSLGQWVYFKKNFANPANNRPAQALNGRRLAKNSFDLPGVTKELEEFDTWQLRQPISGKDGGRDWRDPSPAWIIMPIFFTVVLCIVAMAATFVREDLRRREEGSGGLEERIGKAAYASVPN
jgi:carbonic anhydrase